MEKENMEQGKNKNGIIALLVVLVIVLAVLCVLFATGTISFKSNSINNENDNNINDKNDVNYDAVSIVKEKLKKMLPYVHSVGPYCGDRNTNDYMEENSLRWELSSYSSKSELDSYLKTFMTDSIISKYSREGTYVVDLYKEQNGKLYCLNPNKGGDFRYNEEEMIYKIINTSPNAISSVITFDVESYGYTYSYVLPVELIKDSSNNWLISSYFEIRTGDRELDIIKNMVLGDIISYNDVNTSHKISVVYGSTTATSKEDITSLKDIIKENYVSPNGMKWVKIKVNYDESGYVNQFIIE